MTGRVYVSGHAGMVGSALERRLLAEGFDVLTVSHADLDLTDQVAVDRFFRDRRPELVVHAAAKVGGIAANAQSPADFLYQNLAMEANVIEASSRHGVKRLLFLGSSCLYPKFAKSPIGEASVLTGPIEPTNEAYAVAKIAGLKLCEAFRRQHGRDFFTVVPANLYGPGDHFDDAGHVAAGLIRRFHEAKAAGARTVEVWGSGRPRRDFLFVDDLAEACVFLLGRKGALPDVLNVGSGSETSIRELAGLVKEVVGFGGRVRFDASRPDGMPRRLLDTRRIAALGWRPRTRLREGLEKTYAWFLTSAARAKTSQQAVATQPRALSAPSKGPSQRLRPPV